MFTYHGRSDEARDLVEKLLNKDPKIRLSMKAAMEHSYLVGKMCFDRENESV